MSNKNFYASRIYCARFATYTKIKNETIQDRNGCCICNVMDKSQLQFSHNNPSDKLFQISQWPKTTTYNEMDLRHEIEKTKLICKMCKIHESTNNSNNNNNENLFSSPQSEYIDQLKLNNECNHCKSKVTLQELSCYGFVHLKEHDHTISEMVKNKHSLDSIKEELEHCMLLCANCGVKFYKQQLRNKKRRMRRNNKKIQDDLEILESGATNQFDDESK